MPKEGGTLRWWIPPGIAGIAIAVVIVTLSWAADRDTLKTETIRACVQYVITLEKAAGLRE